MLLANCIGCTSDVVDSISAFNAKEYKESIFTRFQEDNDTIQIGELYVIHNPYNNSGRLRLKGALHNHTENSAAIDGYKSAPPAWIIEKYRDEGSFDFIAITDHNYVTKDPGVEGIVWMGPSTEDTGLKSDGHHLVVYNLPEGYIYTKVSDDINEQIDYYHSLGALVSYAHPDWEQQYQTDEKIESIKKVDFVEVFNAGEEQGIRAYNSMLRKGPTGAFATDDFHYSPESFDENLYFNKSYIMVYGHLKERDSIWNDIMHGRYIASNGAQMEISYKEGVISVVCEKPSTIEFHGVKIGNASNDAILAVENGVDYATYALDGKQPIVWIMVKNDTGSAISQAFHIKPIKNNTD